MSTAFTPEDLLELGNGHVYELIDGQLVEKNVGAKSSRVSQNVNRMIDFFAMERKLGLVFPPDTSYQIFPGKPTQVRKPDGSFITQEKIPAEGLPDGHLRIVPDLAIEVVSPNDFAEEIEGRVSDYLRAGVRLIWVIYPKARNVYIFRQDGSATRLTADDQLNGEDVLPGFSCRVEELFAGI